MYPEAEVFMAVFPQKNGAEPIYPAYSNRRFALSAAWEAADI